MELTAEALLEVLRSLRSDAPAAQMRRRQLPRVGVRLRMVILPCDSGSALAPRRPQPAVVRIRNLSRRGLGFLHNNALEIGQTFLITLPREMGGQVHMLGRVERCRQIDKTTWDIGSSIRLDVPREEINHYLHNLRRRSA